MITSAPAEREVLIQEISLLMKNNFTSIISLIHLKIGSIFDPAYLPL